MNRVVEGYHYKGAKLNVRLRGSRIPFVQHTASAVINPVHTSQGVIPDKKFTTRTRGSPEKAIEEVIEKAKSYIDSREASKDARSEAIDSGVSEVFDIRDTNDD